MTGTVTEQWSRFALARFALEVSQAPARPIDTALLDTCAVAAAGAGHPTARTAASLASASGGRPDARLLCDGAAVPVARAAEANAVAAHVLELDDGHRGAAGHPGTVVFPAALAVGEWQRRSGAEILAAARLGYEWFVRLGVTLNPGHLRQGFHTTCTAGASAAALTAGVLMGLDAGGLADALGHAALRSAGLLQPLHEGPEAKPLQVGAAVGSGVAAAQLAAAGIAAPRAVLEGEDGLLRAFAASHGSEMMLDRLGEEWWSHDIYVKRHSACRHAHAAIDIAAQLHDELSIAGRDVDSVTVETYAVAARLCGDDTLPETPAQARFSLPYTVATALLRGNVPLAAFQPSGFQDVEARTLAERVSVSVAADLEALFPLQRAARVRVVAHTGDVIEREQVGALGDPELPLIHDQLLGKVTELLGPTAGGALQRACADFHAADACVGLIDALVAAGAARVTSNEGSP